MVDTDTGTVVCHQIEGCDEAVAADAKQCVFEGRMRLSSGSDDFVVRRDVTGELWGVAWRMADDGQAWPVDTLASEHVDLGWWWKARGAVVDVERAVACDAVKIEMTLNGAGTFSQTAEAVLRP